MRVIIGVHVGRELLQAIENAARRLWICSPFIGRRAAFIVSEKKGIDIKVLTTSNPENREAISLLKNCGIEVRMLENLHAKLYVVDNVAFVGSMNLTDAGLFNNIEIAVVIDAGEALFEAVEKAFVSLWSIAKSLENL